MWYVIEVHSRSEWVNESVLWGPFPGHEHANRWVRWRQLLDPDLRYTIRPLFKVE